MAARDTRDQLLDTAEALFAEYGFHGVSMRQVMLGADVQLAAIHYHFGRKEDLFRAVIARRAGELNAVRLARMAHLLESHKKPTVEAIADAVMHPVLERSTAGDPGWRNYCRLISQTVSTAEFRDLISEYFDEVAKRAIEALRLIFPKRPLAQIHSSYYFMVGAMTFAFAQSGRLEALSQGAFQSSNLSVLYPDLLAFVASGIRGIGHPSKPVGGKRGSTRSAAAIEREPTKGRKRPRRRVAK